MKTLLLSIGILLISTLNALTEAVPSKANEGATKCKYTQVDYCGDNALTNGLEANQTTLFYMYSDSIGHYFLDPLAEYENVIYVGLDDHKVYESLKIDANNIRSGQRFVGTFVDNTLWELVGLEEVEYE